MTLPNTPDYESLTEINRTARREIAEEIWRDVQTIASKLVVTFDSHAIQVLIYPPSERHYTVPGRSPVTGVMRDGLYTE